MVSVELVPSLSSCVETVAKKEYWEGVKGYLQLGERDDKLEQRLELLKAFLETANFRELRHESEKYLLEGKSVKFILYFEEGKLIYKLQVE